MVKSPAPPSPSKPAEPRKDSIRETVESVVIAFVLAFLFRTFEAEAFVIPTGSMAPTLDGRNKDVACAACGYRYHANGSAEVNPDTNALTRYRVVAATCPVCRYTMDVGEDNAQQERYPSYMGDRILVGKFPFEFGEPQRWDVIVFKYPARAEQNFIKRLVGLPHETLRIAGGDIYTRAEDETEFSIERKPPDKVQAMLQIVWENDFVLDNLTAWGWPLRWHAVSDESAPLPGEWNSADGGRTFSAQAGGTDLWLRYRHLPMTIGDWDDFKQGLPPGPRAARPQLVSDFTAYNTSEVLDEERQGAKKFVPSGPDRTVLGQHWVGDLAVECVLTSESDAGSVALELVAGGRRFQCRFDLQTGQAQLAVEGLPDFRPQGETAVRGRGTYKLALANVDHQLHVWVDDQLVQFQETTAYDGVDTSLPTPADLSPAGVAVRDAAASVTHLRVLRDVYYIAPLPRARQDEVYDFLDGPLTRLDGAEGAAELANVMSDPAQWDVFQRRRTREFPLAADRFLVLGDNSPQSMDSRLWDHDTDRDGKSDYWVTRDLLVGKALYIYWPHSLNKLPGTEIPFPLFPNFERMTLVK